MTSEEIRELAHRQCRAYKHSDDVDGRAYTFDGWTLLHFARALLAAQPIDAEPVAIKDIRDFQRELANYFDDVGDPHGATMIRNFADLSGYAAPNPSGKQETVSLHAEIMNIRCETPKAFGINERIAYQTGHRDARHAAAELALANPSDKQEAVAWLFECGGQRTVSLTWIDPALVAKGNTVTPLYASPFGEQEPIYQQRAMNSWIDCTKLIYDDWPGEKRIVYVIKESK